VGVNALTQTNKQTKEKKMKKVTLGLGAGLLTIAANAQTDIAQVTTSVSGYVTAATAVGVAVLLFVLGRKVIRKLI